MSTQNNLKVIVGLGVTGLSCARYFSRKKIPFAVLDTRENPPLLDEFQKEFSHVQISLGSWDQSFLSQASEIILSPGISIHEPAIQTCIAQKIPVIGDIELFAREAKAPICAITASNGKSTVTSLVGYMAKCANLNTRVGGNLGTAALDLLQDSEPDLYVIELSSFQLETTYSLSVTAATILNISPDHMDRYDSFGDYIAAKQRIYLNAEYMICNRDDINTLPVKSFRGNNIITFGLNAPKSNEFGLITSNSNIYLALGDQCLCSVNEITLKGSHNWSNALASLALGKVLNFPMSAMLQALQTFHGLPHRCEWIAEKQGVNYYNDSKGTNVGASLASLNGLAAGISGKVILIAGGQGKGADFSLLQKPVSENTRAVILIGQDAPLIEKALNGSTTILHANDMLHAVKLADETAQSGDVVLLSPACASFDMFKNFEHRGKVFVEAVKEIL
ncbi:MAG: UDP-N-acetylmuramoyl-L-alanine--D-glutamate ligase [Gammaproteobacteria bacterium]